MARRIQFVSWLVSSFHYVCTEDSEGGGGRNETLVGIRLTETKPTSNISLGLVYYRKYAMQDANSNDWFAVTLCRPGRTQSVGDTYKFSVYGVLERNRKRTKQPTMQQNVRQPWNNSRKMWPNFVCLASFSNFPFSLKNDRLSIGSPAVRKCNASKWCHANQTGKTKRPCMNSEVDFKVVFCVHQLERIKLGCAIGNGSLSFGCGFILFCVRSSVWCEWINSCLHIHTDCSSLLSYWHGLLYRLSQSYIVAVNRARGYVFFYCYVFLFKDAPFAQRNGKQGKISAKTIQRKRDTQRKESVD